jgi:hypothetical protein
MSGDDKRVVHRLLTAGGGESVVSLRSIRSARGDTAASAKVADTQLRYSNLARKFALLVPLVLAALALATVFRKSGKLQPAKLASGFRHERRRRRQR